MATTDDGISGRRPARRLLRRYGLPLALMLAGAGRWQRSRAVIPGLAPACLAVGPRGELYVGDERRPGMDRPHSTIWEVSGSGIRRVAGTGEYGDSGDGGPALQAKVGDLAGLACDRQGDLYFLTGPFGHVRKVGARGRITTVVKERLPPYPPTYNPELPADGIEVDPQGRVVYLNACFASLMQATPGSTGQWLVGLPRITGVACGPAGRVYVAHGGSGWEPQIVELGAGGTPGKPRSARFIPLPPRAEPQGAAVDAQGHLFVADTSLRAVGRVDSRGALAPVAGGLPLGAPYRDGTPAACAPLIYPTSIAFDAVGVLYIADWGAGAVRKVDRRGIITTVVSAGRLRR